MYIFYVNDLKCLALAKCGQGFALITQGINGLYDNSGGHSLLEAQSWCCCKICSWVGASQSFIDSVNVLKFLVYLPLLVGA